MADKKQQPRHLRWDAAARLLTITAGKVVEQYEVEAIRLEPESALLGYRLHKQSDGELYDVNVLTGECDCRGHVRYGYCKHVDGLFRLRDLGMIEK